MKPLLISILVVLLIIPSIVSAKTADDNRTSILIGYVDFNRALNEVSDGRRAKKRLKIEYKEKQKQLSKTQKNLKDLKEQIDKNRLTMSDVELKEKEEKYRQKFFQLQQSLAALRSSMATRETHITEEILARLRQIVDEIGNKEGYSLIVEKSQDVVLYTPKGHDLTNAVIKAYDKKHNWKRGR